MEDLPPGLAQHDLVEGLCRFGITDQPTYVPVGFGDYHWTIADRWFASVSDLHNKAYCGTKTTALAGLSRAMNTVSALQLPFAVTPLKADNGETVIQLDERYALSVFPFLNGTSGRFGDPFSPADHNEVLTILAALHSCEPPADTPVLDVNPPNRGELEALLRDPGEWTGGPYSARARRLLTAKRALIRELLAEFDRLAGQTSTKAVVTHGEPHPGNLIRTEDGLKLIDWDTVGLAIPERDLSRLDGEFTRYTELTGHVPDPAGLALYRLRWRLDDIADLAVWLRAPHEQSRDAELSFRYFKESLTT